jgi:FKBP-type peptidyl-prolyl cis-trans isomerase
MSEETPAVETAPVVVEAQTPVETQVQPTAVEAAPATPTAEESFQAFKDSMPDDLKGHSYLDKYKTAEDFAKAGINHQSALTKKASDYFESEDPVVVAERDKLMGVPESAEGYEVSAELSEAVSEESLVAFKAKAHEMKLPAKYVEEMVQFEADLWTKHAESQAAEAQAETEATTATLKEGWKGDTFDHNTKQVQNLLINELGLSVEDLSQPIGNSAKLITALFDKVVPMYGEDKLIEGTMSQTSVSSSERMNQINREAHSLDANSPAYRDLMNEKKSLMSRTRK